MMLSILLTLLLSDQALAASADSLNVKWPNAFPKQINAVRRRQGLTTSEFLYHHTIVHGRKSWNAPDSVDQPLAYVQDHAFDSAYGINTTANNPEPSYFGHSDIAELYSRSQEAFFTPPPNNYTQTVIGPDGNAFSDFSAAVNMFAYESFQDVKTTCNRPPETYNAFYFVYANATNANTPLFDNATFASSIITSMINDVPRSVIYNASMHTSVPGLDSRNYYGGFGNPTLSAVLKFWLCDDNKAVTAFRKVQNGLNSKSDRLKINLDQSFVMFTRPVLLYDRSTNTPFDTERATKALLADRFRGNIDLTA
ncbi:hypothetical protein EK21DRAFT_94513 [Setomelanomma holmii]|uniref:EthD domain-containing protein n=1 Tax=Setomelanomma holmii TaxID=210430 RepID=A0A9P4LG38_9PLEO|nr:hypothetical protein EK21DRAFT_94513 [Setomelanomma holmii]